MFISNEKAKADKGLVVSLRLWAANMNKQAAAKTCSGFYVKEPIELELRSRDGRGKTFKETREFHSKDLFAFEKVVFEQRMERDGIELLTIFRPHEETLLDVSTVTLPMSEAFETFAGFFDWAHIASSEAKKKSERKIEREKIKALPTVEETRASETWGAW